MKKSQSQRVLVVGLGRSGRAAARLLLRGGDQVVACDANHSLIEGDPEVAALRSEGLQVLHEGDVTDLSGFSLVVTSPGVPKSHQLLQQATHKGLQVIGEMELACRVLTSQKVVAVTGTNGKTTVTLMVEHVLNASGIPAKAVGNVGVALSGQVANGLRDEVLVLELSSYQLETLQAPVIDAAVLLNITPDHLDRHGTMDAYAQAKLAIRRCLKPHGVLYIQKQVARDFAHRLQDATFQVYGGDIGHDGENAQAAQLLCAALGVSKSQFSLAVASFRKPPHRIEFVRTCAGVAYYDDSKGTNIDAVTKAVASLPGRIVLIVGGVDKGASYRPWITAFAGKVRAVFAIGGAAPKIQQDLAPVYQVEVVASLEAAVKKAAALSRPGESVLLSPGCSSFDMFRDYAHRGEEFQRAVRALPEKSGGKGEL